MARFLSLILILVAGLIFFWPNSPADKLNRSWQTDWQTLKQKVPSPNSVKLRAGDSAAANLLSHLRAPMKLEGKNPLRLEVLVVTWRSQTEWGVMLEYDYLDANDNVVLEFGRTLHLAPPPPTQLAQTLSD